MSYFSRWYIQPSIVKIVDAQANDIYDTRIAATSFNGYTFRDIEFIKQSPDRSLIGINSVENRRRNSSGVVSLQRHDARLAS